MSKEVLHKVTDQRSKNMSAIKSKNTKPEIAVRKLLHSIGYRFKLHSGRVGDEINVNHLVIKNY